MLYGVTGQKLRFHARISPTPTTMPGSAAGKSESPSISAAPRILRATTSHEARNPVAPAISAVPSARLRLVDSAPIASPCASNRLPKCRIVRLESDSPPESVPENAVTSVERIGSATAISATRVNKTNTGSVQTASDFCVTSAGLPVMLSTFLPASTARCTLYAQSAIATSSRESTAAPGISIGQSARRCSIPVVSIRMPLREPNAPGTPYSSIDRVNASSRLEAMAGKAIGKVMRINARHGPAP